MTSSAGPRPEGAMLVGDRWLGESSGGRSDHVNPSTGKVDASFALAGPSEISLAVDAARGQRAGWASMAPRRRRQMLLDIADAVEERNDELRSLRSWETGVPFARSAGGSMAAEWFRYYAGWVDKAGGETVPSGHDALDYTRLEPYGVVAVLIPWNAPLDSIGMKVAPALAAGNTVVLKPSELAPFTSLRFAEICEEIGLPPGVLNVTPGDPAAGAALVGHHSVDKISFTGGVDTARKVLGAAAEQLTPVILELGGKSANIVFEDADLEAAVETSVSMGLVALSGQACVLPTRLLVCDAVYDEVVERIEERVGSVVVGHPDDPAADMGPVISELACERILRVVDEAKAEGSGRLLSGGKRLGGDLADGFFLEPTVFVDVDNDSALARHEIFGPVLSVLRFRAEEHAVDLANSSEYGLGGLVFTRDLGRAHRVARDLETGSVGVNAFPPMPAGAPFGGVKHSGYGREGGREGLLEFLRPKNVYVAIS